MSDKTTFEDRIKFHYFSLGTGRVTVAYQMDNNRDADVRQIKFGFAFCSPKDFFSKKDYKVPQYGTKFSEKFNKHVKTIVGYTITKGGRSRAVEMLQNVPFVLTVNVPYDDNAVLCCLESVEDFCYERAPSWKDKANYRLTRSGNHEISRDGVKLLVTKDGIELYTPWEGREIL